ncbi:septum site-determining protein MinC [Alicyclobacillus fastidiosus]|uniref:Probable septum site-determining protein MinC n=1 Tax=Alicyclobacillus fastidiosus TaxID=392011 RepID=A0ABV5AFU6_9BACL|nr:septum site-determining protein MinC [Alicyclobacillus fastidiosus]WEH11679.1 septum site-determining protein MinC [Alicyclobacillus fastidiosus]
MIVNSEALFETKPLVTVKGTRDGLLFLLDEQSDFDALCAYVSDLLSGQSGKVFDGPMVEIVVDYGRRQLTPSDCRRLLSLFLERDNFVLKTWGGRTDARQSLFYRTRAVRGQTIYHGVVRAGEPLSFDGDVVIIGDVNPSAHVRATGDIYVFGRLLGIAHAGVEGDANSIIAATEFAPMQLRINDTVSRAPKAQQQPLHAFMEFAYLENGHLAVSQMKYFAQWEKARNRASDTMRKGSRA